MTNKFAPTSLTKFVAQSAEFLDNIDQDSSVVPLPAKKKSYTMFFIGVVVGIALILVLFLVFKPKKHDQETEIPFASDLV